MSRATRRITIIKDEKTVDTTVCIHFGSDDAIGAFFDITDDRYAGSPNDKQGEGYLLEFSQLFNVTTNLADLDMDKISELNRMEDKSQLDTYLLTKIDAYLASIGLYDDK
jgi:hypothetical protein